MKIPTVALPSVINIQPVTHPLGAIVRVPGSKSLTNRALLIAALAEGRTTLTNALFSDDSIYFADSLRRLGFKVTADESQCTFAVDGLGGTIPAKWAELYVGNAGTAARFLTAMVCLGQGEYIIDGDARMRERPIGDLIEALQNLGVSISSQKGCVPVTISADGLSGGEVDISAEASSQFLSGLLLASPYARDLMILNVKGGINSRPYIDMTLRVMADFDVAVQRQGYERFEIQPAVYQAQTNYTIECDASAASYFFAAPAILGGSVRVENISRQSIQGDISFLNILEQMGCRVYEHASSIEVVGPEELRGVDVDMRDFSDTAQTLSAIAPYAVSPTTIHGIGFIRAKETDRIRAVCTELGRLGVRVEERPDGMTIYPAESIQPTCVYTYNDHRMAMAFALIGLRTEGIQIENPACVSKTFPNYFGILETLR